MKQKNVKIGKDIYTLTAVTCDVSGAISIELFSNMAPLIVAFIDGNTEILNKELRESINSEKLMRIFVELINTDILFKNNEIINDWKEEFQCKPMTLFQLGIEALRFNCEDFFTSISGFAKEKAIGQNWNEVIQSLKKEGVDLPPMFSLLFQNGETKTETQASDQ